METTAWKFFLSSGEAWAAMITDCRGARQSIDIEEYIFLKDEAGEPLYRLLMEKARAGVRVRLILDSAGSFSVTHSPAFLRELRAAGIHLEIFNQIDIGEVHNILGWYFRDHRKILVVDGKIAHIGGVCLQADMRNWRDTQVRISGLIAPQFAYIFGKMWERGVRGHYMRFQKRGFTPDGFQVLINAPRLRQRFAYHELLRRMRAAKRRIWITTPYFIPNYRFFTTMRRAVRRGADVRLLLVTKSAHDFVDRAADFHVGPALRAGIRIFRYSPATLHAKGAIADDWATVGSMNIDNLSLLLNHEANLASVNSEFVSEVAGIFQKDIEQSKEIFRAEWKRRSRKTKLLERLTWPVHRLL